MSNVIQNKDLFLLKEEEHRLILEDEKLISKEYFHTLLNNLCNLEVFAPNSKIHFKLKLNLRDYIIISEFLFPTLLILPEPEYLM